MGNNSLKGLPGRAGWLWSRLQRMPPPEIPHRLREQIRRRSDRRGAAAREALELPEGLLSSPPPAWPVDGEALRGILQGAGGGALRRDVETIRSGPFTMLGTERTAEERADWALDPESGTRWPAGIYTFDIDFRHGHAGRDVKAAWELGRLQHLQLLAAGWRLLGVSGARETCLEDLESWWRENPPWEGVGYASGIELASRVMSVLVVAGQLGPASLPAPTRALIWRLLASHGAWIERYPSRYSSANNHRIAELGALVALGCLATDLPRARRWREEAWAELCAESLRQIHPDGVGAEQTPTYQAYTMEWLLVARRAAAVAGLGPDPGMDARLRAGAEFFAALTDAGGHCPQIGDDDEGVVLRSTLAPEHLPRSVAAALSGEISDLRGALLGGGRLAPAPRPRPRLFPDGGYTVLRSGEGARELHVVFDHAPLGMAPLFAHGHADALSVWVSAGGQPVLVDSGTFRYNGRPEWRAWVRSTLAHNTVAVDGADQSRPSGGFQWASAAPVERIYSRPIAGEAEALHRGYAGLGVIHYRRVSLQEGRLTVEDRLEGRGRHNLCWAWHFASDLSLTEEGERWRVRRGEAEVVTLSVSGASLRPQRASQAERPGPGARSPAYGRLEPGESLLLEGELPLPCAVISTFCFAGL